MRELIRCLCGVIAGALLFTACTSAPAPTTTPAPTYLFPTVPAPQVQATLPPAWTPSHTPTNTPTPSITPTPSPTATLSVADICATFELLSPLEPALAYAWEASIPLFINMPVPDTHVQLSLVHQRTEESRSYDFNGGQSLMGTLPLNILPSPGTYSWQLTVIHPVYGDICTHSGRFIVRRPAPAPTLQAELSPTVTQTQP